MSPLIMSHINRTRPRQGLQLVIRRVAGSQISPIFRRASAGSEALPSLARRVSMQQHAELTCRGNKNRGKGRSSRPQNCPAVTPGSRCFGTMPEDLSKFFEPMLDPLLAVERSRAAQAGPPDAASHAVIPTSSGGADELGTRARQGRISWDDASSLTTLGPIGNPAPVSIVRRAPCTVSPSLVSSHRRCTKPSPSLSRSTEERRGHETFRLFDRARNLTPGLPPSSLAV